jgi:dihydroorotase
MIDPHVHCRDFEENYKATIESTLDLAMHQGVKYVFDMPNTRPPIIDEATLKRRLDSVPQRYKENYFLYLGLTADDDQVKRAVELYHNYPQVIGFKMFAGKSVGGLAIINPDKQFEVYKTLTEEKYEGVIAVHCEKEDYIKPVFNPKIPITHAFQRPPIAEIESIKDQITFAKESGFKGNLHILHLSTSEGLEEVIKAKKLIKITSGVTPHHIMLNYSSMLGNMGLMYKVNPPLRDISNVFALRRALKEDKIDWIESDHAPHTLDEKLSKYFSGMPSLLLYRTFVSNFLPYIGLSAKQIENLTYNNIIRTFSNKLSHIKKQ